MRNLIPDNPLDRCRSNQDEVEPAREVERVWTDLLLNRFNADHAFAEMLRTSDELRRVYSRHLGRWRDRIGDARMNETVDECLEHIAGLLTRRRHRKDEGGRRVFEAGLDFDEPRTRTCDRLWRHLLKGAERRHGQERSDTAGLTTPPGFAFVQDFVEHRHKEWLAEDIENQAGYSD